MSNENEYNNYLKKAKVPYLDEYYTKEETEGLLGDKQNVLTAGSGIEINSENRISVVMSGVTEIDDTVTEINKTWSSSKISGELEGKSNTGHTHDQYSLTGHTHEQYSLTSHTHTISDTSDLQDALDSKSNTGHTHDQYSLTSHTHVEYSLTSHTHTAAEIGALPDTTSIPSKTSDLTNDSGFITGYTLPIASSDALGGVKINGNNLSISNDGTLSATDTTYSASDFDIKDLSDTTGLRNAWSGKQDVIDDLNTIRSGATLGATALQSVPSEYITDTELGTVLLDYYTTGDTYTKTEVNNLIHSSGNFHYEIYANLSDVTDPQDNVLYLIGPYGNGSDKYEEYVYANNVFTKIGDTTIDLSGYATITALTNGLAAKSDTGHTHNQYSLTSHTHSEYSLTSHTHTAAEIGALPDTTSIPSKTSDLTNDSGFITGYTETDPTVPAWAKETMKPTYSVSEISGLSDELAGKSNTGHTHEQYSLTSHTHSEYSLTGHTHDQYSLTSHTHTAQDIGALPSSTTIPSATSQLTNDSGFITGYTETDPTVPAWAKESTKPTYSVSEISGLQDALNGKSNTGHTHSEYSLTGHTHEQYSLTSHTHTAAEVGALPSSTTIPTSTSQLTNDSGFITGFTETDPTVHAWAKAENKPTYDVSEISGLTEELACKSDTGHTHEQYSLTSHTHNEYSLTSHTHTAAEVGALPSSTTIPSKTSQLTNDSGFITTEIDPTVPSWAKETNKPTYTVSEISGLTSELANKSNTGHTHTATINGSSVNVGNINIYAPTTAGSIGNVLTSNGSGAPSWTAPASSLPIGTIAMWATETAPSGWLICNGQSITSSIYTALRNVLGTNNVPDLRQRFPLGALKNGTIGKNGTGDTVTGWSTTLSSTGGTSGQTLSVNEIASHTHSVTQLDPSTEISTSGTLVTNPSGEGTAVFLEVSGSGNQYRTTSTMKRGTASTTNSNDILQKTGGSKVHNNIPPYFAINFIIKYSD